MPTVVPMLAYEDGPAAMEWLVQAFGFVERERWLNEAGTLEHGELVVGADALVMLAPRRPRTRVLPTTGSTAPKPRRGRPSRT